MVRIVLLGEIVYHICCVFCVSAVFIVLWRNDSWFLKCHIIYIFIICIFLPLFYICFAHIHMNYCLISGVVLTNLVFQISLLAESIRIYFRMHRWCADQCVILEFGRSWVGTLIMSNQRLLSWYFLLLR